MQYKFYKIKFLLYIICTIEKKNCTYWSKISSIRIILCSGPSTRFFRQSVDSNKLILYSELRQWFLPQLHGLCFLLGTRIFMLFWKSLPYMGVAEHRLSLILAIRFKRRFLFSSGLSSFSWKTIIISKILL